MPTPVAKGIIITVSALVAAGIAVYESPQFREWVNTSRRKIAVALHNLGDEIHPRTSASPTRQDISMTEELGPEAEERRRIAREELQRRRSMLEEHRKRRESAPAGSFDALVDDHGCLLRTESPEPSRGLGSSTAVEMTASQATQRGKHNASPTPMAETQTPGAALTRQNLQVAIPAAVGAAAASATLIDYTPTSETSGMDFSTSTLNPTEEVERPLSRSSSHTEGYSEILFAHPGPSTNETGRDLRSPFSDLSDLDSTGAEHHERPSTPSTAGSFSQIYESAADEWSDGTLSDHGRSTQGVATPASWSEVGSVVSNEDLQNRLYITYTMATDRLNSILSHLKGGNTGLSAITQKNPDDVVITLALRTPLTKAGKGGFKDTELDHIVYSLLKEVVDKSKIDPALVEDVCLGNVNDGKAPYLLRAASLAAGIPNTSGASSVNRFCSSGLKAVQDIANQITLGQIDVGIALGAELMSAGGEPVRPFSEEVLKNQESADCLQPMGQTSENVGSDFNISREVQDKYAAESYRRAEEAQKAGWFDDEIVPITTKVKDPKTGEVKQVTLTKDEGIRYGTTAESLGKIRPAFPKFGNRSTGGNSSQVTDGAAAILLMRRSRAIELNQPILAKFCGATVAGVPPRVMGIGPTAAIPKLLSKFNLNKDDIDIYEINEAFASMAVYCLQNLGLDHAKVNPRGGAIALGHPLGATGARQICTVLSEARRTKKKVLVTSMCIGTGQGMAGLFVNEQV
ncbi:acetyl-CoA C-acyltransferase [Aspergillus bombycis]|uniref:Acetyl-CoA C-acyltransferase n=1 Tax=Aspergillus bombycis TaxID=109264 RepID=A0A1F7ZYJ1_9EURO|nr:acetyl-CoA C-acyltransferase [Aspergillus bombycis]OGM44497.1 acetyl-CoA C-acyltransferase [Aspergillus bombycis]